MKNHMDVRKGLRIAGLLLLLGVSLGAYGFARTGERTGCPGKVVCPVTGEEICKDQCPLVDANRADCPGEIECPLTGELVCRDRCPLAVSAEVSTQAAASDDDLPPCCRGKK